MIFALYRWGRLSDGPESNDKYASFNKMDAKNGQKKGLEANGDAADDALWRTDDEDFVVHRCVE